MSAQYGFLPNLILQPHQPKPTDTAPTVREPAKITEETAPSAATKVAPSFEANAATPTNNSADQKPDKTKLLSAPTLNLSAESKIAATTVADDAQIKPSDLAEQKAQDLAMAREHASEYREYKARTERALAGQNTSVDSDGTAQPKLDVRIPVLDEIPDRPLPRFGVPTV